MFAMPPPVIKEVFEGCAGRNAEVSVVLLDWSVRESYHGLDYLSKQTINRAQYEVIWIEYYDKQAKEIEERLRECERLGKPPIVDKWIVMGIPDNIYYHKHLMFNIGIIASHGKIITFCDSDATVSPTFVESIVKSFEEDKNIVLHMDEVRNTDRRFYPFNYPRVEEAKGKGCINWKNGKTTGLLDKEDPLHTRNYGACMSALREDLISIGGADEHMDYLGHICGPYEMTFRLVNAGKKEIWHQEEFLYHTWHPGTDGKKNYMGPHDGRNVSTTALEARRKGRVMPLVENPAIRMLRLKQDDIIYEPLLLQAIPEKDMENWRAEKLSRQKGVLWVHEGFIKHPMVNLRMTVTFCKMLIKQFHMKATKFSSKTKSLKDMLRKTFKAYDFLKNMNLYNAYIFERCKNCVNELASNNVNEIVVYGTGDVAEVFYKVTLNSPVKIRAVYDTLDGKKFFNLRVMPMEEMKSYNGKVVVTALVGVEDKVEMLKKMGVMSENIIIL
jgi:hypothetical protein